ncbi:MAG TPA: hypothetical protein PLC80_13730 [Draconibacterium sp.]|nr:hypothetical protein [Draconibacterium sp.]
MKELENIAPELSKIKKENPFRVPDNYFEDFSARLQMKLDTEKVEAPKKQSKVIQILKPALTMAAGFALLFTLAYWPLKLITPGQQANNSNIEIDINEMLFANMVEGIDQNSFFALLDEPNNPAQLSDEDMAVIVNSNSSEYDIYSETVK